MNLSKIQDFLLFSLIFSIPFYSWDAIGWEGVISVPRMIAILYIAFSILDFKRLFNLRKAGYFVYPLILLLCWLFIRSLFESKLLNEVSLFNFSFAQYIILSIVLINHLLRNVKLIQISLIVFTISTLFLSILYNLGIGTESLGGRTTIFGENANNLSLKVAAAGIILLNIVLDERIKGKSKYLLLLLIPQLMFVIGETASRGGLIAFLLGITIIFILKKYRLIYKLLILLVIISLGTYIEVYFSQFEELMSRTTQLFNEGDEARSYIFKSYWMYFLDNPVLGYGENGFYELSNNIFQMYRSPHNWFLYIALTSGIIGLIMFLVYLFRILKAGIKIYKLEGNALPIAIFAVYLFNISKSGNQLTESSFWVFMSIIVAWRLAIIKERALNQSINKN